MKAFILYCLVIVSAAVAGPVKPVYFAAEEDPDYKRFIYVENEEGKIEVLDLRAGGVEVRAELSDVTYYFYTQSNRDNPVLITQGDVSQLDSSPFDPKKLNIFVTHGWNNDHTSKVNTLLVPALLDNYDLNVFVVDWGTIAHKNYLTAKGAVVDIGGFVGEFINKIQNKYSLTGSSFVLIGHSLGAHVSGNAGAIVKDKVDHIIALDPAGPLFTFGNTDNRVDPTDASFVQVIHTNGLILGFASAIGDADYYPNGGMTQPGCGFDIAGTCAHSRSYMYLAESFQRGPVFNAFLCSSYGEYQDGLCSSNKASPMGQMDIDLTASGSFYLQTNDDTPFGLGS